MKKNVMCVFKASLMFGLALTTTSTFAQDFCSTASHSGQSVKISSNQTGKIGDIGYELWDENGHGGDATFYSDGSMECNISSAKDYLCRAGLSLGSNKTYKELGGDMIAEFKLVKQPGNNVGYSYIGVYGWMEGVSGTASQLVEYYVIDNTLANDMPGSWIGNENKGTITVDGGTYTVYRNTRTGPAIKNSGNVTFYQYFSVRTSPRDCGTINISEHMRQWEQKGMAMGKLYEAKVLGEAGNVNGEVQNGHMDFPHAKVYISGSTGGSDAGNTNVNQGGADQGGAQGGADFGGAQGGMDFGGGQGGMDWGNMDFGNMDWGNMGGDQGGAQGGMDWGNMDFGNMDWGNMDFGNMDWGNMGGDQGGFNWGGDQGGAQGGFNWGDMGDNNANAGDNGGASEKTDTGNKNGNTGAFVIPADTKKDDAFSALPTVKMEVSSKVYRVFNTQGRYLGDVELQPGSSLSEAISTKFSQAGIYMVKNGSKAMTVRVSR